MATAFDELRGQILVLADEVLKRTEDRGASKSAERLAAARERLREGQLTVVICGEHKRGKSSLLNALLGTAGLVPTDTYYASRLVVEVAHGAQEHCEVVLDDGTTRRITRDEIAAYAAEQEGDRAPDADRAIAVHLALPDEKLAGGLTYVDTPGVGGVFSEHTERTHEFLASADAVLFVTNFEKPPLDSELRFLTAAAQAVQAADKPDAILFVITRRDEMADPVAYRTFVDTARERFAKASGRPPSEIAMFPVSNTNKELADRIGDATFLGASGFPELEAALERQLARQRAGVLLVGTLTQVLASVDMLLGPLRQEEAALRDTSHRAIAALRADLEREGKRLDQLSSEGSTWRTDLTTRLAGLRDELLALADEQFARATAGVQGCLSDEYYLRKPPRLQDELGSHVAMMVGAVDERALKEAARIQQQLVDQSGLGLGASALAAVRAPRTVDLSAYPTLKPTVRTVRTARTERVEDGWEYGGWRGLASDLGGGRAKEFIRKHLHDPAKVRPKYRTRVVHDEYTEEEPIPPATLAARRAELAAELDRVHEQLGKDMRVAVTAMMTTFADATTAELESLITQERQRLDDTLPRLEAALRLKEEDAKVRIAEIVEEQRPLDEAAERADVLAAAVAVLIRPDAPKAGV